MSFSRDKALSAAQQYAARGELDKAIREYQSVVEHDPKDVQTWLLLADSLHRAGELDAAVDRYAHAANVLLEAGEIPNALQIFRQVLNLAPERYDIHLRTGQAFEQLRRYPEAVALYEKVAGVYLRSGNTREALMLYERVADLMPREVAKRLRLAELFSRERRVEEAIQHFQLGADFLRQAGRAQEYVRVAERLLYHRPLDNVTRELVRVYLEIDQPRRALMKLNELLQRSQSDADGLELLAETFVRLDRAEKAASVVLELVKTQRNQGPTGVARCFKALRKALGWTPNNPQLRKVLDELSAEHGPDAVEPSPAPPRPPTPPVTEEFDDEVEEFEEIDEIDELDEEPEPEPAALEPVTHTQPIARPARVGPGQPVDDERVAPRRHSLTEEVISEGAQRSAEDGDVDFDKQLEEVRVLMKYHLFEHALGHAEQILRVAPQHQQGLELMAEILAALGRNQQAADARASLAQLLLDRDPRAAARHVELALALIPDHPLAVVLGEQLSEISGVDVGIADREDALPPIDDPLGNLELDDDMLGTIEASDSLIGRVDRSLAHDLGSDYVGAATRGDSLNHIEIDVPVLDDGDDHIDIRSADPDLYGELNALGGDDDFAISVDQDTPEAETDELDFEDRFGLGGDDEDDEPGEDVEAEQPPEGRLELGAPEGEIDGEVTGVYEHPPVAVLEDDTTGVYAQPVEAAPEPEPEPEQDWPDLSAELEELDFYLAQDLEDDALAAYNDLVELFPGHPELAKLAARFGKAPPEPASPPIAAVDEPTIDEVVSEPELADAAEPLLDVEDEIADDEDDDDFLANIFDDDAPRQRKEREVAIQTHEVEGADAGDRFDLGTAYREMGLIDKALAEYELAAKDPRWQAKALVMMGSLRAQSGDAPAAMELFSRAVAAARTKDERCESNYELAMALLALGRTDEAKQALEQVEPGYRDREARLSEIA
ncbi:MAG TPA: tetratricopeptide repeat protein [Enhygromyxa sp.]|nr:tetratricopeptide repeat protein [Enhygromyxa sp.]